MYGRGGDSSEDRVQLFVMGANRWQTCPDWPPPTSETLTLYLSSDGRANSLGGDGKLVRDVPADDPPDVFLYDPRIATPSGEQGPAPRHHLHLVVTDPQDGPLVGVPCDFAVQRPVAASVLRLLAERAGYEGPERRRNLRVAIGAPVEVQCSGRVREAILAQVSASGCGLVANAPLEAGARLAIRIPPDLTAPRRLTLGGRVLGARRTTTADGETWKYRGEKPSMYDVEHVELFNSIKEGKPINNGKYMCYSTMLAILGRMATYTGQRITWEEAWNSQQDLTPESYEWGPVKLPPEALEVAMPGKTVLT